DVTAGYFKLGQPVRAPHELAPQTLTRVTQGDEDRFIGLAVISDDGLVAPRRLVVEYTE
ncbi:tRNA pseudouridine synthase B, partial [Morganella morganii]